MIVVNDPAGLKQRHSKLRRYFLWLFLTCSVLSVADRAAVSDEVVSVITEVDDSLVSEDGKQSSEVRDSQQITALINHWINNGYVTREIVGAEKCDDAVFFRRVYLDLAGRIPTQGEFNQWMSSTRDRDQLIRQLIAGEDFVQQFTDLFDALLMGRVSEDQYHKRQQNHWRAYLEDSIRQDRSWKQVVREILLARPSQVDRKGAVWFLYERNNDFQKIAEAISPSIFGVRIECAQCHDHMMADEIKQAHYWGLVAFFNRSKNSKKGDVATVDESAIGGFSEFADLSGSSTPNYLTFLEVEQVNEDRPATGEEQKESDELYTTHVSPIVDRVPKFSRREQFVKEVVEDHPRLALAFVNRVWAMLMGRGLVHPFDEMDSMHPPSHPELLEGLAQDARESDYDLRRLVHGIVSSNAYQQSSIRGEGVQDPASFAWYLERPLTGEQMARSTMIALRGTSDVNAIAVFRQQFPDVLPRDYVSTVKDALFLSNGNAFQQLIEASNQPEHLIPRVMNVGSREQQVKILFETLFARNPDVSEMKAVVEYLETRSDRIDHAIRQVIWSMLTSAEFRLNH